MAIRTGADVTAAARAARTRAKRDRWIRELSAAGWSVVEAGHISVEAQGRADDTTDLNVFCLGCQEPLLKYNEPFPLIVPLPAVLAAVNGHTCEERS